METFLGIFFGVAASALVLLISRAVVLWYWKVNDTIDQLGRLEAVLRNIDKNIIVLADNSERALSDAAQVDEASES